ncbi:septation regulator SpoVG [Candidatus Riflebacteria bacterium]
MKVTDVRIKKMENSGKLKAFCSITFDDVFVVHDIKLLEGQKGLFIAMPRKKTKAGEFRDIAHPIEPGLRENIFKLVLEAYENDKEVKSVDMEKTEDAGQQE